MDKVTEEQIRQRMDEILEELSQHEEFNDCFPTLEALGDKGDIRITLVGRPKMKGRRKLAEKVLAFSEPLTSLQDTFNYPNVYGPRSKDFNAESIRAAYINLWGDLMIEHTDGTVEEFRVKSENLEAVKEKLRTNLGKKLKA